MKQEKKMKTIKGDLIMTEDMTFDEDLKVEGDIYGKDGDRFNLTVRGDLNCRNLDCRDLNCWDLDCRNLDCRNLNCRDLNCWDLDFYAVAIAYNSFKCESWKAKRENYVIKCLDGKIEVTGGKRLNENN
jgi:hypothetical protein